LLKRYLDVVLIGIFFAVAIPLVSFLSAFGFGMSGGYKVPLAYIFTQATTLNLSCAAAFICFRYLPNLKQKLLISMPIAILVLAVGLGVNFLTSGFGVLADPSQDPWKGKFVLERALTLSLWGTLSGFCLGVGASRWAWLLPLKAGITNRAALAVSLLGAWFSISLGIAILFT
jgi:hypothetical protein